MNNKGAIVVITATILSGMLSTNVVQANEFIDENSLKTAQLNQSFTSEVIKFKDPTIKVGAAVSLLSILGHFPTDEEFTKDNLEKITSLFTPNGSPYPTSLEDFEYMPNLEFIDIRYFVPGKNNLDPSTIGKLKNLKEFHFNTSMETGGGGLTSLLPFKENKHLTTFGYYGNPITDASDCSLDELTSLENLEYTIINNNSEVSIGDLNHLPKLQTIKLSNLNLVTSPALKQSTNLSSIEISYNSIKELPDLSLFTNLKTLNFEFNNLSNISNILTVSRSLELLNLRKNNLTNDNLSYIDERFQNLKSVNLSVNSLSQIPDFSYLSKLTTLNVSNNNIGDYTNLDKLNQMMFPPSVNIQRNILTANPRDVNYKGSLDTWYNFISGQGLIKQIALRHIANQTISVGNVTELPIIFEWEDTHGTDLFLSDFQKSFVDTKNMNITTDNDNVLVEKSSKNSIKLTGKSVGTTKVIVSYGGNVKSEFIVTTQ